jgi:hypothetical protein
MPEHEIKICGRCGNRFECKVGSIMQCQCFAVQLNELQRAYIAERYADCLCVDCIQLIIAEMRIETT